MDPAHALPASILSGGGAVTIDRAFIAAAASLTVHARGDLHAITTIVRADQFTQLISDCGRISAAASDVNTLSPSLTTTYILAQSPGDINADSSNWASPQSITLKSISGNISARGPGTYTSPSIVLHAGGGHIDTTGRALIGTVTYGPPGVQHTP